MHDHGKKDARTKWKGYDTVRFKDRIGSLRCPNPNCPFILKFGEGNRLKFNSTRILELCSALGEIAVCPARKYAAYISEKKARIFHFWTQICETCKSWNEVENIAKQVTDKRPISNEKIKQRQQALPYGEGYEATREYKLYADEKDPLLIYSVNEKVKGERCKNFVTLTASSYHPILQITSGNHGMQIRRFGQYREILKQFQQSIQGRHKN